MRIAGQGTDVACGVDGCSIEQRMAGTLGDFYGLNSSLAVQCQQQHDIALQPLGYCRLRIKQVLREHGLGTMQGFT